MTRTLLVVLLAAVLAGSLAGCGRKGDPEVPAGQTDTLTRKYPNPKDE
ncbi:MAG: lipoprotein [Alphaproteobacteria bacterium]